MASTEADILKRLPESFNKAKESGDLLHFPSTTHIHPESGVEFEIKICPALLEKPKLPATKFEAKPTDKKSDPFAPPYNPLLLVGELKEPEDGSEYAVILNKYSVIPQHFLLVTKEFQSQSAPLMPTELLQTYLLILAAKKARQPIFAFYNCGDISGASQPHKHIQFIPIEDDEGPPIEVLARQAHLEILDRPFSLTALPYANHVARLPRLTGLSPAQLLHKLTKIFLELLDLVISTVRHDETYPPGRPSFNVIMTQEHIHLIPRRHETCKLDETGEELSVNSLGFAGHLLAKSDTELEAIIKQRVGAILRSVGLESYHDEQVVGDTNDKES